jgi:hypothetical protein
MNKEKRHSPDLAQKTQEKVPLLPQSYRLAKENREYKKFYLKNCPL